uniref:Uncharacterized protein n=1 Tax=Cyprinus carpio TaxID=7962 RepID=A0A8C2FIY1_CYPCA
MSPIIQVNNQVLEPSMWYRLQSRCIMAQAIKTSFSFQLLWSIYVSKMIKHWVFCLLTITIDHISK